MTTTAKPEYKVIGTRPIRHDGVDKVIGRAQYGADIRLPGMLHGKVLRSPHPHARIISIDTSKAEAHPDVRAVATSVDLPDPGPVSRNNVFPKGYRTIYWLGGRHCTRVTQWRRWRQRVRWPQKRHWT